METRNFKRSAVLLVSSLLAVDAFLSSSSRLSTLKTHKVPSDDSSRQYPSSKSAIYSSASDLLYQDQQAAMLRRALREEELLSEKKKPKELKAAKVKAAPQKAGTGFGAASKPMSESARLGAAQAKIVERDGVFRINEALSAETSDRLRAYLLDQQRLAAEATEANPLASKLYYGVEQARKNRCDMHLSLTRGGIHDEDKDGDHIVADALSELLCTDTGSLRPVFEALVTDDGELYEVAGIITNPGSERQMIHPDLPYQKEAPLYVIFLALQDVSVEMGPTQFLLKSHTKGAIDIFDGGDMDAKDEQLRKADCRLSLLKKGDAVLFDARVLHCGGANDADLGKTRVMLNFSFRNPKVTGDIGYKGSIMPGYVGAMSLGDVTEGLDMYKSGGDRDPFAKYGNGIKMP